MATAPPETERLILEGRLHPAALVLDMLRALRKTGLYYAFLAVQIWISKEKWLAFAGTALLALGGALFFVVPILRYLRFRYRLTDTSLYITSGVLSRRHRRIPLDRVQDVSSEAELAHRLLGVVKLSVQTSSTAGAEAELDCLSVADAEALRRALESITVRRAPAGGAVDESHEESELVYQAPLRQLLLRGLTDNRAGLIVLAVFTVLDRAFELGEVPAVALARDRAEKTIGNLISSQLVATIALVSIGVFVFGWVASAITNAIRFHGFSVHQSRGVFYRRYGLFTRRVHALPMRRIQALRIEQTLLRRAVGIATVRTDDMGSSAAGKSAESAGVDVFIPVAPTPTAFELAPRILPGLAPAAFAWKQTAPTMIRRAVFVGGLLALAIGAPAAFFVGAWAALALILPVLLGIRATLRHRRLEWACGGGFLALRDGVLGREHVFAPLEKIQAMSYVQNPFDRRWRVGKLIAVLGGGTSVVVPNLPEEDARLLLGDSSSWRSRAPDERAAPALA